MKRTSYVSRVGITVLVILLAVGMIVPPGAVAQDQGEDEPNDAQEAATAIEGTSVDGEITKEGGTDWFSKEFTEGETVSFAVTKALLDGGLKTELYAPNGSEIDEDMGYHGVGTMEVSAPADESGEYYVEIEAVDESYTGIPYTVYAPADESPSKKRSTEPVAGSQQESEPNDEQANSVTGEEVTGEISTENDSDWYAFQANKVQNISLLVTKPATDKDLDIKIHSPDDSYHIKGEHLNDEDTREQKVIEIKGTGMHYLEVSGEGSEYTIQFSGDDLPIQPNGSSEYDPDRSESTSSTATDNDDTTQSTDSDTADSSDTIQPDQNTQAENGDDQQETPTTETTSSDEESVTSLFGPGFTGGGAIVALFVTALFALRRQ